MLVEKKTDLTFYSLLFLPVDPVCHLFEFTPVGF
jgi:hypothetical protein